VSKSELVKREQKVGLLESGEVLKVGY